MSFGWVVFAWFCFFFGASNVLYLYVLCVCLCLFSFLLFPLSLCFFLTPFFVCFVKTFESNNVPCVSTRESINRPCASLLNFEFLFVYWLFGRATYDPQWPPVVLLPLSRDPFTKHAPLYPSEYINAHHTLVLTSPTLSTTYVMFQILLMFWYVIHIVIVRVICVFVWVFWGVTP